MSTYNGSRRFQSLLGIGSVLITALLTGNSWAETPSAAAEAKVRVSLTRQIGHGGRKGPAGGTVRHEYGALRTEGNRGSSAAQKVTDAETAVSSRAVSDDFWFYDADVILFNDFDGDGYYHGIDLLFDADTYFEAADVYAVVYLSFDGGPWNEYSATDDFTIYGASSDDEYVVVTELESSYPAGSYDLLIELYDAYDGSFLAEFGPADSSGLSFLTLEDQQRDARHVDEVVVVHHGGGNGYGLLLLMILPLLARRLRRLSSKARA